MLGSLEITSCVGAGKSVIQLFFLETFLQKFSDGLLRSVLTLLNLSQHSSWQKDQSLHLLCHHCFLKNTLVFICKTEGCSSIINPMACPHLKQGSYWFDQLSLDLSELTHIWKHTLCILPESIKWQLLTSLLGPNPKVMRKKKKTSSKDTVKASWVRISSGVSKAGHSSCLCPFLLFFVTLTTPCL